MVEPTQDRNSDQLARRVLRGPRHFTCNGYLLLDSLMRVNAGVLLRPNNFDPPDHIPFPSYN